MITLTADSELAMLRHCCRYIESRGGRVRMPDNRTEWHFPGVLAAKVGLTTQGLQKRLNSPNCPQFEAEHGQRRMTRILVHPRLLEFLTQPKQPGKRLNKV